MTLFLSHELSVSVEQYFSMTSEVVDHFSHHDVHGSCGRRWLTGMEDFLDISSFFLVPSPFGRPRPPAVESVGPLQGV